MLNLLKERLFSSRSRVTRLLACFTLHYAEFALYVKYTSVIITALS